MRKNRVVVVILGIIFLFSAGFIHAADKVQPKIHGKTYGEWSALWMQWLESQGFAPVGEQGDVDCSLGQKGPVWFLAGTGGGTAERRCVVSTGKDLFFPLVNAWFNNLPDEDTCANGPLGGPCTEEEKREILDGIMSDNIPGIRACNLDVTVDGVPALYSTFAIARTQSPTFLFQGDEEAVADGFWVMLHLSEGDHELHFKGAICEIDTNIQIFSVDVVYELSVE